jgi:hypothetical protein
VEDNAGRRTMSKLRVNALWGKYVQSDTCCHRIYLNSLQEYLQTIQSPRIKRNSLVFRQIFGDLFECRFEYLEERGGELTTSIPTSLPVLPVGPEFCYTKRSGRPLQRTATPTVSSIFINLRFT